MHPPPPPDNSEALVDRIRAGDEQAWAQVYADLAPRLAGYLHGMQLADIDDIIGDVFVRMVRSIASFEGGLEDLRAWAYAIARNARLDLHRRESRDTKRVSAALASLARPGHVGGPASPNRPDDTVTDRDRVLRLLEALTERQREVMLLRIVGDLTLSQVAYVVGEQLDTVKQLQRRASVRLRDQLESEGRSDA